jgi:hypothetical protein
MLGQQGFLYFQRKRILLDQSEKKITTCRIRHIIHDRIQEPEKKELPNRFTYQPG